MKKIPLLVLTCLAPISIIGTSCSRGGGSTNPDTAYLTIGTYDGGIKTAWIEKAAARFIEKYGNQEFEEGKTKIEISVQANKNYDGATLVSSGGDKDIYFSEGFDYYAMKNSGKYLDLSDIMTTANTYDDNKIIVDKIDEDYRNYLNIDDHYYGIPFYDSFYGMVYDLDAWKEKEFYLNRDGRSFSDGTNPDVLSAGPDGEYGTYDDGLPATYAEFKRMLKNIVDQGYLPFQYPKNNGIDYMAAYPFNMWANQEGKENMMIGYNFEGTATDLISFDSEGKMVEEDPTEINTQNGYLVHKQKGLYQTLTFVHDVLSSDTSYFQGSSTHTSAQKDFVFSADSSQTLKVAMLCDGSWWENEAAEAFNSLSSRIKRHNYAIMPMPFAEESDIGRKQTILSMSGSYGIINTNVTKNGHEKLAKAFMQFLTSDAELQNFTLETNMTRPLNYDLTQEQTAEISTYTASIINIKKNKDKVDIVYPYSSFEGVVNDYGNLQTFNWAFHTSDGSNPFVKFSANQSYTSVQYFNNVNAYFKNYWETKIIK